MNLIASVSANWGIGKDNELLFRIKKDLARFRTLTLGKTVVMGHNTFKSIKKPLDKRKNIVLTRNKALVIPGVTLCRSMLQLRQILSGHVSENVFVIGGETVYTQLLNDCALAYITKVNASPPADAFFPNLDELSDWRLTDESETFVYRRTEYRYCLYENIWGTPQ